MTFLFVGSQLCTQGWTLTAFAFACGKPVAKLLPFRRALAVTPLPSASISVMSHDITGFTYRGLPLPA